VISFKNMAAGAALTSKINDWAFEISENTWQNSINALNHFSAYRSSDPTCEIKYSLVWTSRTLKPSGAVESDSVVAKKLIDLLITQGPANEAVSQPSSAATVYEYSMLPQNSAASVTGAALAVQDVAMEFPRTIDHELIGEHTFTLTTNLKAFPEMDEIMKKTTTFKLAITSVCQTEVITPQAIANMEFSIKPNSLQ
jgi:hypothetical protein